MFSSEWSDIFGHIVVISLLAIVFPPACARPPQQTESPAPDAKPNHQTGPRARQASKTETETETTKTKAPVFEPLNVHKP